MTARKKQPTQSTPKKQPQTRFADTPKKTRDQDRFDPLHQVAFWGLALLLFFPPYFRGLFFAPEQEKALIFATLVFWLAFLWRWLQKDNKFMRGPLDWFALALPLIYIVSSFTAVNKGLAIDEVVKNILYFMTYWSVSRLVRDEEDVHKLLHVVYVSAIGVALAGLATATGIVAIKDGFLQERIYSTFQYPNALASYLGAVILLGLYLWQRSYNHTETLNINAIQGSNNTGLQGQLTQANFTGYLYACGNFLLLAVLFGTKSRGALLVFGLVFLIYLAGVGAKNRFTVILHTGFTSLLAVVAVDRFISLVVADKSGRAWLWIIGSLLSILVWQAALYILNRKLFSVWADNSSKYIQAFVVMVAVVVIAIAIWLSPNTAVLDRITDYDNLKNAHHRVYYIGTAWEMILDRPLLGWGGGGWKEAYQSFMDYNYITRQVHSFYFQVGVETGFPGLLTVGGIWFSFLYLVLRLYRSQKNQANQPLMLVLLTMYLLIAGHALIDFDLSLSALTMVLWCIFGITTGFDSSAMSEKPEGKKHVSLNYFPVGAATVAGIFIVMLSIILAQSHSNMQRGLALLRSQQVAGIAYVEKAAACSLFNVGYRITLSQLYMSMGEPEKALVEAQRAVELSSFDIAPRDNLAQIAMAAGKPDIASEAAEKTVELAPNRVEVYQNIAKVYTGLGQAALQEGNIQEAREYFEKCLQVPERMENYWNSLSEINLEMWRGKKLDVNRNIRLYMGQANYWMSDFSVAEKHFTQAAKDKNLKGEALLYLALVKEKQGNNKKARQYLEQAQKIIQEIEKTYENLSKLKTIKG